MIIRKFSNKTHYAILPWKVEEHYNGRDRRHFVLYSTTDGGQKWKRVGGNFQTIKSAFAFAAQQDRKRKKDKALPPGALDDRVADLERRVAELEALCSKA